MKNIGALFRMAAGFVVGVAAWHVVAVAGPAALLPMVAVFGLLLAAAFGVRALGHKNTSDALGQIGAGILLGGIGAPFLAIAAKSAGAPAIVRHLLYPS
ncbi:MAG: hypothetical protein JO126_01870 [Alphaproteobacteria bacterium]|nr:hypothetical protein [Alphaproteobacteria bacterium]MBV8548185.1 hypothetical protein [Alphaproteobacteria bacterium]